MPAAAAGCLLVGSSAGAQPAATLQASLRAQDLKRLSIEELAEIDVTTVSRRMERLSDAAAAVSVITSDDIRRAGYTTLADVMRLAGGLDVGRINSSTWGISARGFNTSSANKLLVLIDGRSVYSPLSAGTFWDAQDIVLPDIDRIEIIRGPGGALWGANAVNGVINVITKPASATRGTFIGAASGSDEHALGVVRHGGRIGATGSYRVYGKYRDRGQQLLASGADARDEVKMGQGGFRLESDPNGATRWLLQGDLYRGTRGFPDRDDGHTAGGNIMGRWMRRFSSTSEFQLQAYYDRTARTVPLQFEETRDTFDVDAQHTAAIGTRHQLTGGAAFRVSHGNDVGVAGFFFDPPEKTDGLFSAFVQDEIEAVPRRLFVTLGSKFERNDFTGLEVQPTARVRWSAPGTQTLWGAVSRAVRLPARFDTDLRLVNPVTRVVTLEGSRAFESEKVIAYEAGYRIRPHARLSLDAAVFANRYDDLRSTDLTFRPNPVVVLQNRLNADTSGIELLVTAQPAGAWQLHASYAHLRKTLSFDGGVPDFYKGTVEGNDPSHVFTARSYLDLPARLALDAIVRHTSERPAPVVAPYTELNVRVGWTVRPGWDLSIVGQHLLEASHPELSTAAQQFEFRRGVYLRSAWRF